MVIRIGHYLINLEEILWIDNYETKIKIYFKSGICFEPSFAEKDLHNFMEYFNALSPDLNDDYTRKMMIQHIINQRTQMVQRMMAEGQLPKSDFIDQVRPNMKGPALR
jgi:hypothetical protein